MPIEVINMIDFAHKEKKRKEIFKHKIITYGSRASSRPAFRAVL